MRKISKRNSLLRKKILTHLRKIGFVYNPHLQPSKNSKNFLRQLHEARRKEQLLKFKSFLKEELKTVQRYYGNLTEINSENIKLKLIFVESDTEEYTLFKWFSLVWWSLPYENSIGRGLRYLIFDCEHGIPFGLVQLQSPILRCKCRDDFLGIKSQERDYWINQSLNAQRVGALPPYNQLFGNKLVAMSLCTKEINEYYQEKYNGKKTLKLRRILPTRILFTTTFSAFGRSSIYENLFYRKIPLSIFLGYTKGSGTFHISDKFFKEIKTHKLSNKKDPKVLPSFSLKLRILSNYSRKINLQFLPYHNIKRGVYLFPLVKNLIDVIQEKRKPIWLNISFKRIFNEWNKTYNKEDISIKFSLNEVIRQQNITFLAS